MSAINASIEHGDRHATTAHGKSVIRLRELVVSPHAVNSRYISSGRDPDSTGKCDCHKSNGREARCEIAAIRALVVVTEIIGNIRKRVPPKTPRLCKSAMSASVGRW